MEADQCAATGIRSQGLVAGCSLIEATDLRLSGVGLSEVLAVDIAVPAGAAALAPPRAHLAEVPAPGRGGILWPSATQRGSNGTGCEQPHRLSPGCGRPQASGQRIKVTAVHSKLLLLARLPLLASWSTVEADDGARRSSPHWNVVR